MIRSGAKASDVCTRTPSVTRKSTTSHPRPRSSVTARPSKRSSAAIASRYGFAATPAF